MKRDFLTITDFSRDEMFETFELAKEMKLMVKKNIPHPYLQGKTLAMIFQKPSARTRISFETGMFQLGGHALYLSPADIGLGKRESVADVARVLSRYNDIIMARVFTHNDVVELANYASIPVVNGLSDWVHPCQLMGDLLTIQEHKHTCENLTVCFIGDGNNLANSWMRTAIRIPINLRLSIPEGYDPDLNIVKEVKKAGLSSLEIIRNPGQAAKDADVLYTDVWASMGMEVEAEERKKVFQEYQVNDDVVKLAAKDCVVMHCLPAHRGDEITDSVIDGPHSIVFDQAENRMHVQKAIMVKLLLDLV